MGEVKHWVGQQLSDILLGLSDPAARMERAVLFVLEHTVVVQLWIRDMMATGGTLAQYFPRWQSLLAQVNNGFLGEASRVAGGMSDVGDADLWGTILLSMTVMAPRLYQCSVRPGEDRRQIAKRFAKAYMALRGTVGRPVA